MSTFGRAARRRAEREAEDNAAEADQIENVDNDDNITDMNDLMGELHSHISRVGKLVKSLPREQQNLGSEIAETLLPLVLDVAKVAFSGYAELRQYIAEEVDPYLDEDAPPDGDSLLTHEDAQNFRELLTFLRDTLGQSAANMPPDAPPDARQIVEQTVARTEAAIARVAEIEEEDEDDAPAAGAEAESPADEPAAN